MLKSKTKQSLAGTSKEYIEVENAEGLRIRVMNQEGESKGNFLRIHVLRDAPEIDSRERDKYFAFDVPWTSILKLASRLFDEAT